VRIARPVRDLTQSVWFYRDLVGLAVSGGFDDHDGYDHAEDCHQQCFVGCQEPKRLLQPRPQRPDLPSGGSLGCHPTRIDPPHSGSGLDP
jgi:catechol 2,3-dioxygenase-like lactoylglutathione lyase family enzyme